MILVDRARASLDEIGSLGRTAWATLRSTLQRPFDLLELFRQIEAIGVRSTSIVVLTAIFSSMVMTVQFAVQLARFGAREYVGNVVSLSLVRELGPVMTALMVGGRMGAGITAELGAMNVTEQIDAIRALGADPIKELVWPRVMAGIIALPLLTALADVLGVLGALGIAQLDSGVNASLFFNSVIRVVTISDLCGGLTKTVVFGFLITLIACHQGLRTRGGTEGVGLATTRTVVITSIVTLIADFVLTELLLGFGM